MVFNFKINGGKVNKKIKLICKFFYDKCKKKTEKIKI